MLAFDIDGTLASTNFSRVVNQAQLLEIMANASVKYHPRGEFAIVTARGESAAVQRVTRAWVRENFPNCKGIYFTSTGGDAGMKAKLEVIKRHGLDGYVDSDNSKLSAMRKLDQEITLYDIVNGKLVQH